MGNIFNVDNAFFTFLGKVCDIIFLSILWVVLCIPVITIGPATTALYYATVKVIRRERGYLFREFFKSFKLNFKRGAIIGVVLTVLFLVLRFDISWAWANLEDSGLTGSILFGAFIALTFLVISFTAYVFPILSRFDMTIKQLVKASLFMSIRHIPYTLGIIIITAVGAFGIYLIPIAVFILPAAIVLLDSLLMERVLKKYMPKAEESEENTGKDEWYLE